MLQPTRLISTPFAQEGDKTEIQNVTGEFDNSATYRLGFPPLTMQSIRLGGKPPKGTDFNGVLFDITENISFLCKGGRYQYNAGLSTLIGGYPEGSNLLLDDNVTEVVSTVAGNQNNPNINMTGWILKPNKTTAVNVADASGETQQQVNYNGGSKWHSRVGGYQENERVVLVNGDIVKSTIDGNTNDPNVDMTGWVPDFDTSAIQAEISTINTELSLKADTNYVDAQDSLKADKIYVDTALSSLSTEATKFYPTLALANSDIANLAVNQAVNIGEAENGGLWYKATSGATTLTKSAYDPLTQAKADATAKANTAEANAKDYTDSKTPIKHISTYPFSISDESGNPILKIKKDGTLVVGAVEDKNGLVGSSGVPLDKIFNNVSQLDIFINHGQSNGSGGVPTTPPVTDTQEYNNVLLNNGVVSDLVIAPDKPEVPTYKMMNHLSYMTLRDTNLNLDELSSRNGVFSIAISGTGIITLYDPIHSSFKSFRDWLIKIKAYCDTNNITCNVKAMLFTHGEFDAGTMTVDEYLGHQYALYDAFNSEAKTITGQKNDMKFLTWELGPNNAGKAQIKASGQHPNMLVAFPKYCGFFGDGVHYDAIGTALVGAYYAKAYRYYFEQGKHWQPLMYTSCEKYGANAVKVKFNRSGLTFDSSRFSATGGGFYGTDSSGALTVSSYIVDQNDNVIVTFNRVIVGELTFGYGRQLVRTDIGNNFGGTLRDNEGLFETTTINETEYPLHNWALTFEEVVK